MGSSVNSPNRTLTPESEQTVLELYASGLSLEKVGAQIGYSREAVRKVLLKHDAPTRSRAWRPIEDPQATPHTRFVQWRTTESAFVGVLRDYRPKAEWLPVTGCGADEELLQDLS
jgi:hypothetical protein